MSKKQDQADWRPDDVFIVKRKNHHYVGQAGTVIEFLPDKNCVYGKIGVVKDYFHVSSIRRPKYGLTDIE